MKQQIRLLGIDDSPFSFCEKYATVIGVVMRGGEYLECVLSRQISIDGEDATFTCIDMINNTKHRKQLRALLLDGVTMGGFNVIDVHKLYNSTNIPIITVTRDRPDFHKIKMALKNNFSDWEKRLNIMKKGRFNVVKTKYNPLYMKCVGIDVKDAKEIIKLSTIRGVVPEPIRIAHIIASGIKRGESYGKA